MTCHPSCSKNNALQWRWHWHLSNCSPMDSHVIVVGWYLSLHYWIRHHCLWDTFPPFRVRSVLVTNCLFVCLSANSNWKELVQNISWPYIFTLWKPKFLLPFGIRRLRSLAGLSSNVHMCDSNWKKISLRNILTLHLHFVKAQVSSALWHQALKVSCRIITR